jgi:hypothetical protein
MSQECWFDHENLEVGLIKRNSTRNYDKGNPTN